MARKKSGRKGKKKRNNGGRTQQQPKPKTQPTPEAEAQELEKQSREAVGEASVPQVPIPDSATADELRLELQLARQSKKNFEAALKDVKRRESQVDKQKTKIEKDGEVLAGKEQEAAARLEEAKVLEEQNEKDKEEFSKRLEDVVLREENAKDGFLKEKMTSLEELQTQASKLRTIIAETTAYTTGKRVECDKECADRIAQLDQREDALKASVRELDRRKRQAGWQEEDVAEIAKAQAAHEIEKANLACSETEARLKAAREECDRREKRILDLEASIARGGGRSYEEVVSENEKLENKLQEALTQLKDRPLAQTEHYARELESKLEKLTAANHDLQQDLSETRAKAGSAVIAVTEVESLRDEKLSIEKRCELLKNANDTLRAEYEQIIAKAGEKTPFESCSSKDDNNELQSAPASLREDLPDLPRFCEDLQQRMAHDPDTGKTLYYSTEDVRSLVAGLCMSRLHILQGISGTGKTSLPKAFARAIGAGWHLVPIQAGWRDREDLIGHFNSFQNKYYESEFLKALYNAQCPEYADRPYIIILDEMNLSHPEQYFADFISLMEQEQDDQVVALTTFPVANAPRLFVDGSRLKIPPNVWFIGTANHDETTMDFADKTYDRAHVMELPRHRIQFQIRKRQKRQDPLAMSALLNAAAQASREHGADAKKVAKYLDKTFLDLLGDSFGIGWGNRLERQLNHYVPVVIACGGSIGEAADHILATKLLRKLRGRHDNTEKDLKEIQAILDDKWIEKAHDAQKSRAVINEAIRLVV